ncbi:MAG: hypothetical protein FRX48_08757 [Lasallia pustulata]|uniref:Uncharacterized protein n=1 Tax=Lasallia pustulata TaxID=136370 RepID=A0A5M8PF13_9LECA|nr:MAG: hypothetical protein FRX48_08757 [Lasallia pustulata]
MAVPDTRSPIWLLLLPDPPSDVSLSSFKFAYEPALSTVLSDLANSSKKNGKTSRLDIALYSSSLSASDRRPRSVLASGLQKLLGVLYRLVCIICAEKAIDVCHDNDVDARIFLLGKDLGHSSHGEATPSRHLLQGPIIDFQTLAHSSRPWIRLFSLESEDGETLLKGFFSYRNALPVGRRQHLDIERVGGGLTFEQPRQDRYQAPKAPKSDGTRHYCVAVGGTFDHLHPGHKLLLSMTALTLEPEDPHKPSRERTMIIGITGDELLTNKKHADQMQSWDDRQQAVREYLSAILDFTTPSEALRRIERFSNPGPNGQAIHEEFGADFLVKYVEISDPFGPTITDESISALIVSGETRSGGKAVNDKRTAKGWSALDVLEVDVLDAEDNEETGDVESPQNDQNFLGKISSTAIRQRLSAKSQT